MNKEDKDKNDIVYDEKALKDGSNVRDIDSDVISDEGDESTENLVKKLREKLKICEKEKQEYMNGWQRERADFINFKKRSEEEKKEYIKFANENLLEEMLTVLESFDMAFMNKEQWNSVPENWRIGVEYIHSQLVKILEENGLKEFIPKVGDTFNPTLHIAEETISTEKKEEDNIILSVKKKGYMMNGKIIIAPKVSVGELKN
ncbi:MAG: nucleotide exchange factor GrpE [Minisyncoccia bacterium]